MATKESVPPDIPHRLPDRVLDIDDSGAMIHRWSFQGVTKELIFYFEKCIGCDLCRLICPTSCIELGPVAEIASGTLEGVPPILLDHEKCAYCFLCARICPTGAFEHRTEPDGFIQLEKLPRFHFMEFVDEVREKLLQEQERSFDTPASSRGNIPEGWSKPATGEVILRHDLLDRCDPMGCKGCLNICPTDCFWVPKKAADIQERGKITMDDDLCISCGACKNACPERIIDVVRTEIKYEFDETSGFWREAWENNIKKLMDPSILQYLEHSIPLLQGEETGTGIEEEAGLEVPPVPDEIKQRLLKKYETIKASLARVNFRYWIEFKKLEKLRKALGKIFPR